MLGNYNDSYEDACYAPTKHAGMGDLLDTLSTVASAVVDPVGTAAAAVAGAVASDVVTSSVTQAAPDASATGAALTVDPSTGGAAAPAAGGSCPPPANVTELHTVTQEQILQAATLLTQLGFPTPQDPTGLTLPFRTSVCQYQTHRGVTADGELGTQTYGLIVADAGALPQPGPSPAPTPPAPTPDNPTPAPASGNVFGLPWWAWALLGVGVLGGGAVILRKKKG